MKLKTTKLLAVLFLCICSITSRAQMQQYCIGTSRNEIATKVLHLPDGSRIIAGYIYDISSGSYVVNAQMILLRLSPSNTILWQTQCGIPNTNNLVMDMIVTHDGSGIIVVGTVGRNSIYSANRAIISRYQVSTGSLVWRNVLNDAAITSGGELFFGVTELGAARNYELVAVGAHNYNTSSSGAMICVFNSAGVFQYNSYRFFSPTGGQYQSVIKAADDTSVYICGQYNGNYGDGIVAHYVPAYPSLGVTAHYIWENYYDFSQYGTYQDNFFSKIFLSGTKLLVSGGSLHDFSTTSGSAQFVFEMNTNGTAPFYRSIKNAGAYFANSPAIAMVDSQHVFTVQSPALSFYDPVLWTSSATTSAVITNVTSLSGSIATNPVKFNFPSTPGLHSILDMQYAAPYVYLAGSTNASVYGNNDIYFVETAPTFASSNRTCDTVHDSIGMATSAITNETPTFTNNTFAPLFTHDVIDSVPGLRIALICGDQQVNRSATGVEAIENNEADNLTIYPNPLNDIVTIQSKTTPIEHVIIMDITGKIVFEQIYEKTNKITISLKNNVPGTYFVKINNNLSRIISKF